MPSTSTLDEPRPTTRIGRPAEPVPQGFADEIVEWIANGKTLRAFSQQPGRPSWRTIYDWIRKDPAFRERFERARQIGFDSLAEECLEIADELPADGRCDARFVRQQRLRIQTRLKVLARWCPGRYGSRIAMGGGRAVQPHPVALVVLQAAEDAGTVRG